MKSIVCFLKKRENLRYVLRVLLSGAIFGLFVHTVLVTKGFDRFLSWRLLGSIAFFSFLYCILWSFCSKILAFFLNLELSRTLILDSVTYLPTSFLLLYPIVRGKLILLSAALSISILKLAVFGNGAIRSGESRPKLPGARATAALVGLLSVIGFNLTYSVPVLVDDLIFVGRNLSLSYDQKMSVKWGSFYEFMCFICDNTSPTATIVIPPQGSEWPALRNWALVNYFLHPRKLVGGSGIEPVEDSGRTFCMVLGRKDGGIWPAQRFSEDRAIWMKPGWGLIDVGENSP